tara:strand:+ start:5607 stop:5786 length:180 start_codon:yes stop_codon:yes gene_type:complete
MDNLELQKYLPPDRPVIRIDNFSTNKSIPPKQFPILLDNPEIPVISLLAANSIEINNDP